MFAVLTCCTDSQLASGPVTRKTFGEAEDFGKRSLKQKEEQWGGFVPLFLPSVYAVRLQQLGSRRAVYVLSKDRNRYPRLACRSNVNRVIPVKRVIWTKHSEGLVIVG